jgi:hypothetical protein
MRGNMQTLLLSIYLRKASSFKKALSITLHTHHSSFLVMIGVGE